MVDRAEFDYGVGDGVGAEGSIVFVEFAGLIEEFLGRHRLGGDGLGGFVR